MPRLFFIVNQDLLDGSAHALYCFRHCWWLATADPTQAVELIYPGARSAGEILAHFGFEALPNFALQPLPAVRKSKGKRGVTVNLIYYWALYAHLQRRVREGDWLIAASFAKLFRFLLNRSGVCGRARLIYEVHQLALLDYGADSPRTKLEMDVLARVEGLMTTTEPLRKILVEHFPRKPVHNLSLACGFAPDDFPRPEAGNALASQRHKEFTVAYIGSIYREQGVEWLIGEWARIQKRLPVPARLEIAGGTPADVEKLRRLARTTASDAVSIHGAIPPRHLSSFLRRVDALVIPALAEGRMPYVAITKAYDYPGLNRPIVASDLPSIAAVLRRDQEALLFAPGQADDCAQALASLIAEPELASRLVKACRQLAGRLSWKARAEKYLSLLKTDRTALSPSSGDATCAHS